jgi:hypothetical protein
VTQRPSAIPSPGSPTRADPTQRFPSSVPSKLWTSVNRRWRRAAGIVAAQGPRPHEGRGAHRAPDLRGYSADSASADGSVPIGRRDTHEVVVAPGQMRFNARSTPVFHQFEEAAPAGRLRSNRHALGQARGICRRRDPESRHADHDGYVPFGKLVNYAAGRTDGCPSWSPSDTETVIAMAKDDPTTLYIYPESRDIDAVARAVEAGQSPSRAGLYWNAACLKEIGSPNFWPRETLEPILAGYKEEHPAPPPRPAPICTQP